MKAVNYYAHTKTNPVNGEVESQTEWQPLMEHLRNVSELARKFGDRFGSGKIAGLCGILHDIGKYSDKFQKRLNGASCQVDHSTAGAVEISKKLQIIGFLPAYCIAGHHAGLPDGGSRADTSDDSTLFGRLKKEKFLEPYSQFEKEIDINSILPKKSLPIRPLGDKGFSVAFYVRMLFSCLVDGDFLDTETFMSGGVDREIGESIDLLNLKLDEYIKTFGTPERDIDKKRTEILNCCIRKAVRDKGLYTLTVPTGGGKTVSSLAFALKHAQVHRMDRVIYVIPYNSIIEQNAAVFKDILGEENVLEHHSDFDYNDANEMLTKQRLATENWDMPVIVTTTVQFFESLFANRTSKCRKLHNIANSVIIFDEAQMLPIQYLLPCVRAISELVYNYSSTVVLCSATQPALGRLFPKELVCRELCDHTEELFRFFKRTNIISIGELQDGELSAQLSSEDQVLCIVNTRKQAQNIFKLLTGDGCFHLSTLMCPQHRREILHEIRLRLKGGLPCRVVSTSLIEAGVDVDFPVVYRAEAGLDSEVQAAGRCNREGKNGIRPVYIFRPAQEYRKHMPAMQRRPMETGISISNQFADIASPEAAKAYFTQLYDFEGEGLDTKKIVASFEDGFAQGLSFPFAEVASKFKLIENSTHSIVIPRDKQANELVQKIREGEHSKQVLRQIQQYTVSVYDGNYNALFGAGKIQPLDDELAILVDGEKYSEKTGLDASTDSGVEIFI